MFCCAIPKENAFSVHTIITKTFYGFQTGCINVFVDGTVNPTLLWKDETGKIMNPADPYKVENLGRGIYELTVVDEKRNNVDVKLCVDAENVICVSGYNVQHATSDFNRDGRIEARISGDTKDCRFMWSTHVFTERPVLEDVAPGIYGIIILPRESSPLPVLYVCHPATVKGYNGDSTM